MTDKSERMEEKDLSENRKRTVSGMCGGLLSVY